MRERQIEAKATRADYLIELFRARELFYFFAWRDLLVRYKQAFFGIAWALFRPLMAMALFTLIFSQMAHFESAGVPYPLFALAGMLPWMLFSSSLSETAVSLINHPSLLSRVYFPRMILPASQVLVQLADFLVALVLLLGLMLVWGGALPLSFALLPLLVVLALLLCLGCGLIVSALTLKYRDVRHTIPFFIQLGIYLSPVGYGSFMIPEAWRSLYFLNPVAGIIEGLRAALFGVVPPYLFEALSMSIAITLGLLVCGFCYFQRCERQMGDDI